MKNYILKLIKDNSYTAKTIRYYYDCPIKTCYMWQYFGIKTYIELSDKGIVYDKYIIEDWSHLNEKRHLVVSNRELRLKKQRFFVVPEYNDIFQPIIDDLGISYKSDQYFYTGEEWLHFGNQTTIDPLSVDIIFRKKQFFTPELEFLSEQGKLLTN